MVENIGKNMRRLWSRDLQNLVSDIRDGTFKYEEKSKKSIDWKSYNEAQLNELADMLIIIRDSVDIAVHNMKEREIHTKMKGPGRPRFPDGDVAKALLLQCYFGVSDRVAGGLLKVFDTKLGISEKFSYKTIERGYDPERTKEIFDEVFRLTNEWSNFNETTLGTDGSGDPTTMKVNYESKRAEQRENNKKKENSENTLNAWPSKKKDFQYSVISSGMHTKIIAGFSTSSNHHLGELSHFPEVMRQAHQNAPNAKLMLGDPLYACRPVCNTTYSCGLSLYSLPKSNVTLKNKGCRDWSRMMCELILDPQGFLNIYHDRSISETVNSMMKRRELIPIRKKLDCRKDTAECLKINIHNLRQSCYLSYLAPHLTKLQKYQGG
jgi:transposase